MTPPVRICPKNFGTNLALHFSLPFSVQFEAMILELSRSLEINETIFTLKVTVVRGQELIFGGIGGFLRIEFA